jgi:hypothetical protein
VLSDLLSEDPTHQPPNVKSVAEDRIVALKVTGSTLVGHPPPEHESTQREIADGRSMSPPFPRAGVEPGDGLGECPHADAGEPENRSTRRVRVDRLAVRVDPQQTGFFHLPVDRSCRRPGIGSGENYI